jgi:hypothetical protein
MFDLKMVKAGLMAAAMVSGIALAPVASAALTNGSFELPNSSDGDFGAFPCGGDIGAPGWSTFNCNFVSSNNFRPGGGFANPAAQDGSQVLKQFGADAGATQRISASAGDVVEASAYAINWSGDPFKNLAILQISYYDAGGGLISDANGAILDEVFANTLGDLDYDLSVPEDGDPASDWTLMQAAGIAPDGTAEAQILLIHILTEGTPSGGSIWWDNADLTATPSAVPVPAAAWLFGSALLGLMGISRRKS